MAKKYYVCPVVVQKHDLEALGEVVSLNLSWTDGMVGVMPVFTNKKKAEAYSGKLKGEIIIVEGK